MAKTLENNTVFDKAYNILQRFDIVRMSTGGIMSTELENDFKSSANYTTASRQAVGAIIGIGGSFIIMGTATIATFRAGEYVLSHTNSPAFAFAASMLTGLLAAPAWAIGTHKLAKIANKFGFD